MPLPIAAPQTSLARYSFIVGGVPVPCRPTGPGKLTGVPGSNGDATPFFFRDTIGGPLTFTGDDFELLLSIENSTTPCLPIGLLMELRPNLQAPFMPKWQGVFTCREQGSAWDLDERSFSVTPATDDAYRLLLENWETEINLLDYDPRDRRSVTAQLGTLASNISIEFKRIDKDEQPDYVGKEGWALFWLDDSDIYNDRFVGAASGFVKSRNAVIFRYRLRNVPLTLVGSTYVVIDKSGQGYERLGNVNTSVSPPVIDYVKTPGLDNFQFSTLRGYGSTTPFKNTREYTYGGNTFLSLPCNDLPSQHGFVDADFVRVTGPEGGYAGSGPGGIGMGGANNAEGAGTCLNVREEIDDENFRSIYWRFGSLIFKRCFPLTAAIRFLLQRTGTPIIGGVAQPVIPEIIALVPPSNELLSQFYSASTNPATLDSGPANEIPGLLVSAAYDVKRYGASEPATRLMISLKQMVSDACAQHDLFWYIDPATGWFRMEHRVYAESQYGAGPIVDLRTIDGNNLPRAYTTRQEQLPRYEELTIAAASTVEGAVVSAGVYEVDYAKGTIDYGPSSCANGREGQNRTTITVSRLSGDIPGFVLNGDQLPGTAIAVLAPDASGRVADANRVLSASRLAYRYYRYGRVGYTATVNGRPVTMQSVRPQREQAGLSVPIVAAPAMPDTARFITSLGTNGQLAKRELNTLTGVLTLTVWLPIPVSTTLPQLPSRQFSDQLTDQFA